jgi:hypothetical protein
VKAALFIAGLVCGALSPAYARITHYSADIFVRKIEAAMQIVPGSVKIDPRFGLTIQYLGTKSLPDDVYAIYVKKLD